MDLSVEWQDYFGCPCCGQNVLLFYLVATGLTIIILNHISNFLSSKSTWFKATMRVFTIIFSIVVFLFAIFLGIVANDENSRRIIFTYIIPVMRSTTLLNFKCEHIKNVGGRVLEIGPGPGSSFKCWENNTEIVEWIGVEPNHYFEPMIHKEMQAHNLSFPTQLIWKNGEDLDVAANSIDHVVSVHVFCSIDEVEKVLQQVIIYNTI